MQHPKKSLKSSPSGQHRTTLSGYIFATKAHRQSGKKLVKTAMSAPHVLTICFSASLQAHQAACFVMKRSIISVDRHNQFKLLKKYSDVGRQLYRHTKGPTISNISILYPPPQRLPSRNKPWQYSNP